MSNKKILKIFKKLVIIISAIFIVYQITIIEQFKLEEIRVEKWNEPSKMHLVCKAKTIENVTYGYEDYQLWTAFDSKQKIDTMIDTNKEEYKGKFVFYDENLKCNAALFYEDNNYYALIYEKGSDSYRVQNCYLEFGITDSRIYVPSPSYFCIDYKSFRIFQEYNQNTLDTLFEHFTFEQAKEFYERFEKGYVKMNEDIQTITVNGYNWDTKKIVKDCVTFDFRNKTVSGKNSYGEIVTLDGTETSDD